MTTHYSTYTQIDLNVFFSDYTQIDLSLQMPGGFLSWTKTSPTESNVNLCRIHQTVEATFPLGSTTQKISKSPEFVFQNIYGDNIFTSNFKSPCIYLNDLEDPRVVCITNEILSFIFGDDAFHEESFIIRTQYIPKKIVASRKLNGKIGGYCYFSDNNIYAFEIEDEIDFSSSSSSNSSSQTNSDSSYSSNSSTNKKFSSESSLSSKSSKSSGSSSSLSTSSSSKSSSTEIVESSTLSSKSSSSQTTLSSSTRSTGSSSS